METILKYNHIGFEHYKVTIKLIRILMKNFSNTHYGACHRNLKSVSVKSHNTCIQIL